MRRWMTWRAGWLQVRLNLALTHDLSRSMHCSWQVLSCHARCHPSLTDNQHTHAWQAIPQTWQLTAAEQLCRSCSSASLTSLDLMPTMRRQALPATSSTDASQHEEPACLADEAQVAIFDATNSTESRRQLLVSRPCMQGLPAWPAVWVA